MTRLWRTRLPAATLMVLGIGAGSGFLVGLSGHGGAHSGAGQVLVVIVGAGVVALLAGLVWLAAVSLRSRGIELISPMRDADRGERRAAYAHLRRGEVPEDLRLRSLADREARRLKSLSPVAVPLYLIVAAMNVVQAFAAETTFQRLLAVASVVIFGAAGAYQSTWWRRSVRYLKATDAAGSAADDALGTSYPQ